MKQLRIGSSEKGRLLRVLTLGTVLFSVMNVQANAQRGSSGRGDSGGSRSDSSPRRDDSSSRRDDSSSRRDSAPSRNYDPPARRDYSPPARSYDPPARRDYSPPARTYDPPARRDYSPSQRDSDPPARRDYSPPIRRDDTPLRQDDRPRRDISPPPSRDRSTGSGTETHTDRAPARTNDPIQTSPERDRTVFRRTNDQDRTTGAGNAESSLNRNRPTRDPGSLSTQERNHDAVTRGPLGRNPDLPAPYRGGPIGTTRTVDPSPQRNRAHDIFTRSAEGRRYNNGIVLHEGIHVSHPYFRNYFPSSFCFFGFYSPVFSFSSCYYSPYSYYYDCCPPYIYRHHCFYVPPPVVYIEVPVYVGGDSYGYDSDRDDYYLSRGNYSFDERERETGLDRAVDDIREAFRFGNVEPLVQLTDPNIKISVFRKGKYEYSLAANDYLDMTRDALKTTETIRFDLYRVRKRASGVYVVSGKHEYSDHDGRHRTVYVSFVLERVYSRWTLTQVGTAPDRIQDF